MQWCQQELRGKRKKESLSIGDLLSLSFVLFILGFMIFAVIGIIMQKTGYSLSPVLVDKILYSLPILFCLLIIIFIGLLIKNIMDNFTKK